VTSGPTALLTFSIGPVHTFIGQARRIADLWAGSAILSDVTTAAMEALLAIEGADLIFPNTKTPRKLAGVPNRFVAHVPGGDPGSVATTVEEAVTKRWATIVAHAKAMLTEHANPVDADRTAIAKAPWSDALTCAWSWVAEEGDYRRTSDEGAQLFAASRVYRPFGPSSEAGGVKCAICGERNALPDGDRERVKDFWQRAEQITKNTTFERYFRYKQTRLCLVCTAKRLYPTMDGRAKEAIFDSFDRLQPDDGPPYFAVVTMDGDSLGDRLSGDRLGDGDVEEYQRRVSSVLSDFAKTLRTGGAALNLSPLGIQAADEHHKPQLIYAGGEDVLFVADPRDALPVTAAIRELYQKMFSEEKLPREDFTISAAVLFAHTSTPAGLLFKDAERLLKAKAKAGKKNAVAVRLHKGSGTPVEVVLPWDEKWLVGLTKLQEALRGRQLASRQTYDLAEADRTLHKVFTDTKQWRAWLEYRLRQGELSEEFVTKMADLLQPFFEHQKIGALRIARFLAVEAGRTKEGAA
jgi:hypothetical protein